MAIKKWEELSRTGKIGRRRREDPEYRKREQDKRCRCRIEEPGYKEREREHRRKYEEKQRLIRMQSPEYIAKQKRIEKNKEIRETKYNIHRCALRHNTTVDYLEYLCAVQRSRCVICKTPNVFKEKDGFQVDHCHGTGKVRGLLCTPCNQNVMNIVDKKQHLLFKAMDYKNTRYNFEKGGWDGKHLGCYTSAYKSAYRIYSKYGVNIEERQRMYAKHSGRCAICNVHKPFGGVTGLHIDHCHQTGHVRGLLCTWCNKQLMKYVDNQMHLIVRAFEYKYESSFCFQTASSDSVLKKS